MPRKVWSTKVVGDLRLNLPVEVVVRGALYLCDRNQAKQQKSLKRDYTQIFTERIIITPIHISFNQKNKCKVFENVRSYIGRRMSAQTLAYYIKNAIADEKHLRRATVEIWNKSNKYLYLQATNQRRNHYGTSTHTSINSSVSKYNRIGIFLKTLREDKNLEES